MGVGEKKPTHGVGFKCFLTAAIAGQESISLETLGVTSTSMETLGVSNWGSVLSVVDGACSFFFFFMEMCS